MHEQILNERYRIDKVIGRGGMAQVYKAFDLVLRRYVAVKVLHKQFVNNAHFIERFRREAYAAASLIHPNITTIYDTGCCDGLYYIVMEYVEGRTLKQLIDEEAPLPIYEAIDIARQVAKALGQAHHRKIIHRDIKPQNILVTDENLVKVTDFGIARALMMPGLTQTGKILGTARYISPEQAKGCQADERSDIYSLGVIIHEMLTGKPLFEGNSSLQMAEKHVKESPPSLLDLNPNVPLHLEIIVGRLLRKEPAERYQNIGRLLEDLSFWESREKRALVMEEPPRDFPEAQRGRRSNRGKHAAKNSDSSRRNRETRKEKRKRREQTMEGDLVAPQQYRSEQNASNRQTTRRKRLTPFGKTLLSMVFIAGISYASLYVLTEPQGQSLTQQILKKQALLEQQEKISVQGVKTGELKPAKISDYDPEGAVDEYPGLIKYIADGDRTTAWSTETYRSTDFGKLKDGVGVYLDYGVARTVKEINVVSSGDWSGEIRGSQNLTDWTTLRTVNDATEDLTLSFNNATYRYYSLWITIRLDVVNKELTQYVSKPSHCYFCKICFF
ncbi:MAG: protein kinase [Rubrobacteridae bacterium]|nr:protein kinase [Rubrobacteridae bacterium]